MSRSTTIILSVILVFNLMISCKSDEQTLEYKKEIAAIQAEQTELKWLGQWFGEGKKEDLVREMARDFSFLNQDVNLELQFAFEMAKIDSFADPFRPVADSIISWIQNDRWPFDIFVCDKWFYSEIAGLINDEDWGTKHLLDFKDEDWFIESHKDYVLNSDEYVGSFGGIAPGAFIEGAWDLLYVSSEVEDKLGIKVKDYNMSIDDFIEYAKIVHLYNQTNNDKITLCATNYQAITQVLNQVIMSEIGKYDNASATEQISALNKVYKKLEELAKYKPTEQYHEYSSDRELKHDKTLFHLHSTWVTLFWQRSNPEGEKLMRPCEFPSMPNQSAHSYSGTYNAIFAIPKKAKNRDAAVRLMQYMSSVDIAEKWENYSKCPTGLNSRMSFSEFGNDDFSNFSKHMSEKYDNRLADFSLANDLFNGRQGHVNFHAMDVAEGRMSAAQAISRVRSQLR